MQIIICSYSWLCCYMAQMNPLIGPKLPKNTILMMAREWVNMFSYYNNIIIHVLAIYYTGLITIIFSCIKCICYRATSNLINSRIIIGGKCIYYGYIKLFLKVCVISELYNYYDESETN